MLQGPSAAHWLGTDQFGRDVLTRLIWSTRVDLRIGFLAVLIPFVVGTILGGLAGYFGGWLDMIVMRLVDIFFAFPFYVMVIALVFVLGAGETSIYLAIAAVSWVSYAKIVRGEILVAKQQDYVMAARLGGFSHLKVLARHIGPNVLSQAIIYAMSDIVQDIMAIVTLGYLGLGRRPAHRGMGIDDRGRAAIHYHAVAGGNDSRPRGRRHQPRTVLARRRAVGSAQPGPEEVR